VRGLIFFRFRPAAHRASFGLGCGARGVGRWSAGRDDKTEDPDPAHQCTLEAAAANEPQRIEIGGAAWTRVGEGLGNYKTMTGSAPVRRGLFRELGVRNGKTVDLISLSVGAIGDGWLPQTARAMAHHLHRWSRSPGDPHSSLKTPFDIGCRQRYKGQEAGWVTGLRVSQQGLTSAATEQRETNMSKARRLCFLGFVLVLLPATSDDSDVAGPDCSLDISNSCYANAQCRFLSTAVTCVKCVERGIPGLGAWTEQGGDAACACVTRAKEARPGPFTPVTCGSFGGSWHNGQCYFLVHPGLGSSNCSSYGGTWDTTTNKCYLGNCSWVWL
jgi:hypothetical protein